MRNSLARFLTMAAALALVFSAVTAPAGAADNEPRRNMTTVFNAGYEQPEVKVIVPTTGAVFINPYEEAVTIGTEEETGQILSVSSSIANLSRMPLQVDVSVYAQIAEGSTMGLASASTKDVVTTAKRAFMYFEMKNVTAALGEDPDSVQWDGTYDAETDLFVKSGVKKTKKNMVTLAAATRDGQVSDNGAAAFHLDGDAVKNPKVPWDEKDGVQVTVTFSFKPMPYS